MMEMCILSSAHILQSLIQLDILKVLFLDSEEMVHAVIDALDGEGGVAAIPGIDISVVEQKRNLANKILSANARLSDQTPAQARIKRDYEL